MFSRKSKYKDTREECELRLKRARIRIGKKSSFFAYIALYLNFTDSDKLQTMGITRKGNLLYNKQFVASLTEDELMGCLVHEINHIVFDTFGRCQDRNQMVFNIASDIAINSLLQRNNFQLPDGVILPSKYDNSLKIFNQTIKDCHKKIAEELYDEIKPEYRKMIMDGKKVISNGEFDNGVFDEHFYDDVLSKKEQDELRKYWEDKVGQAYSNSKAKGDVPEGYERLLEKLHEEKIAWKTVLQRFITNNFAIDYTWARPHKKSMSVGNFMPSTIKESVDVVVMVDLSGSVGEEEFKDFMSEIVGMAKAFREKMRLRVLTHETQVNDDYILDNANEQKILELKLHGGGGTSFAGPIKYLQDNDIKPKIMIWFSDGYGDEIDRPNFPILWIISSGGDDSIIRNTGQVIKLK